MAHTSIRTFSSLARRNVRIDVQEKEEDKRMKPRLYIRSETQDDIDAITDVTIAAFKTLPIRLKLLGVPMAI